jgi:hypothetical protein
VDVDDEDVVDSIRSLTEGVRDPEEARKIIADEKRKALVEVETPRRMHDEDEADRIRARVQRGKGRDLQEDTHGGSNGAQPNGGGNGPLASFGMGVNEYSRLAGQGKPS